MNDPRAEAERWLRQTKNDLAFAGRGLAEGIYALRHASYANRPRKRRSRPFPFYPLEGFWCNITFPRVIPTDFLTGRRTRCTQRPRLWMPCGPPRLCSILRDVVFDIGTKGHTPKRNEILGKEKFNNEWL